MQSDDWKTPFLGRWQGETELFLEPPAPGVVSATSLSVRPVAGDSFLQLDYTWSHEGEEHTGLLLLGRDDDHSASAAWIDSFHMSSKVMPLTGTAADGSLSLLGSYAAPPGPDWGWRILVRITAAERLQIVMHNIWPEGKEDLAVEAEYKRVH